MVASGGTYQRFRNSLKAEWQAVDAPCVLCGQPIDWGARAYTPDAFELDHKLPVSTHPHLELDPTNAQPSHHRCNRTKGPGTMPLNLGTVSEAW